MTTKTKTKTLGNLLRFELDQQYNHKAVTLAATAPDATPDADIVVSVADAMGYPLKLVSGNYVLALAGDEGTVDALLLSPGALPDLAVANNTTATYTRQYTALLRGPATISKAGLPLADYNGDAFNLTTLITQLATLNIITFVEPTKTSEQLY